MPRGKLTPKQKRFVEHYLIDPNATQAALRAGYSKRTAKVIGSENLSKPSIAAAIAAKQQEIAEKNGLSAQKVIGELMLLGFANMQDYLRPGADGLPSLDFAKLTRGQAAALQEVTCEQTASGALQITKDGADPIKTYRVKFKLADKRAALVDLGKHLGLFADRLKAELTGAGGGPVVVEVVRFAHSDSGS
jgi:phage terminase small subunit